MYVLIILYFIGYLLAYAMLRVEHAAEGHTYTKGDRVLGFCLALLSFALVLYVLVSTWVLKIALSGYWKKAAVEPKQKTNELTKAA